ncbi:MAG TPA: glycosyltransferase family 4 protein [Candidatus Acidoferrum sp.]|nr:glycosyltransferase family 4 protein [Candidatus Acidoferrum sp.]
MSSQRLIFVMPPDSGLVSGGNIYNRELLSAARRLGREIEEVSVAGWERLLAGGASGVFFVDTVSLDDFMKVVPAGRGSPGQRFLLVVHHLPSLEPGLPPDHPSLALEAAALPRFDGFLATSPYTATFLAGRGHTQRCMTVRPALPLRTRAPLDFRPGVRALIAGNLIPRKGVLPFIHALAAALGPGDRLTVDVVGRSDLDPDHAGACVRAARGARLVLDETGGVDVIRFRGPVPYETMDGHYGAASVFLSPSLMETFGMAMQEARAFGLPILACRGGHAAAHVEHGASGYLCDSIGELVDRLMELVREPERLRELFAGAQARRSGSEYTWDVAAAELLRQLDDFDRPVL